MNGILLIDKPRGWTSHDVVNKVRRLLGEKRIGHTGTLDPLATGLLVLCVGKATRIARYLESDDKVYLAEMRLGETTDTQDSDGKQVSKRDYTPPSRDDLEALFRRFTGHIMQRPPAYSAVKVGGVPSYRMARKGQAKEHDARQVTVHSLVLLDYADPIVHFRVHCSKGTYVRTLCADMGEQMTCGAHLTALSRLKAGRFALENALTLEHLAERAEQGTAGNALVEMAAALDRFPGEPLTAENIRKITHGNPVLLSPRSGAQRTDLPVRLLNEAGELIAVGIERNGMIWPEVVLA